MKLYSIKNWANHYEKAQTRKVERAQWVPMPLKHDGKGYRRLIAQRNGAAIYGAWVLIVQVAAKCPTRGVLADEDGPLSSADLALKTGCPESVFEQALEVLCSPSVGWMLVSDYQPDTNGIPLHCNELDSNPKSLQLQDRTGQDITEQEIHPTGVAACAAARHEILGAWNSTSGVVHLRKLTEKRSKALRARLADRDWDWQAALAKFPLACFADGKWLPTFDWFVRPDTVLGILEGKYDWSKDAGTPSRRSEAMDFTLGEIAQ